MLEQIKKNGRVYDVSPKEKSVSNNPVKIPEIQFGPYRPVTVYRIDDYEMWVKDEAHGGWYHYKGNTYPLPLVEKTDTHDESGTGYFYLYGMAEKEDIAMPYFVQDMPYVQKQIIPDIQTMEMPFSMRALDYERVFSYPQALKDLLKDCPAAYADRFKRPIVRSKGHTYPVDLKKQSFKWEDLPDSHYPVTVYLFGTHFAILDLEPVRTPEEEMVYESVTGYYEEETIRGGKHKLVRLDDTTFKFRYGKGLELIANGLVTFYGINGVMLSSNPPPMKTTGFAPVGYVAKSIKSTKEPEEIKPLLEKLEAYTGDLAAVKAKIQIRHSLNTDDSNREFNILNDLYRIIISPYRNEFDKDSLPWILAACSRDIIEPREKHTTQRNGLPYLVYLSAIICQREGAKIWKPT